MTVIGQRIMYLEAGRKLVGTVVAVANDTRTFRFLVQLDNGTFDIVCAVDCITSPKRSKEKR